MSTSELNSYTIDDLTEKTGLSKRNVRYYVQLGLVDKPVGETRAARYGARQLEQLMLIAKWTQAGLSLEAIGQLLDGKLKENQWVTSLSGQTRVKSHVTLTQGIEVVIDAERLGLDHEQLRRLISSLIQTTEQTLKKLKQA